jgi:hypothetical protein
LDLAGHLQVLKALWYCSCWPFHFEAKLSLPHFALQSGLLLHLHEADLEVLKSHAEFPKHLLHQLALSLVFLAHCLYSCFCVLLPITLCVQSASFCYLSLCSYLAFRFLGHNPDQFEKVTCCNFAAFVAIDPLKAILVNKGFYRILIIMMLLGLFALSFHK